MKPTSVARLWPLLLGLTFAVGPTVGQPLPDAVPQAQDASPKAIPAIFSWLIGNLINTGAQALTQRMVQPQGMPANAGYMPAPMGYAGQGYNPGAYGANPMGASGAAAPCYASSLPNQSFSDVLKAELARSGCQVVTQFLGSATNSISGLGQQPVLTPTIFSPANGEVPTPFSYQSGASPNYQGIKISVQIVNEQGQVLEVRPIGSAFYTGEKFRLLLQSSFPGLLEIQHTNPAGLTKQLFPNPEMQQFMVSAGGEVTLPLGNKVYEFNGQTGVEQLILTVRDPRLSSASQINPLIYRSDVANASYYAQPVANNQLPMISQTVQIQHRWR